MSTNNLTMKSLLHLRGTLLSLGASANDLNLIDELIKNEKNRKVKYEDDL